MRHFRARRHGVGEAHLLQKKVAVACRFCISQTSLVFEGHGSERRSPTLRDICKEVWRGGYGQSAEEAV
jgi:hypothetical protein